MKKDAKMRPDVFGSIGAASGVLAKHGNRLLLIEATVVLIVAAMPYYLFSSLFALIGSLSALQGGAADYLLPLFEILIDALFSLFVMLPLFCGALRMARLAVHGETVELTELFAAFYSKSNYARMLAVSFSMLWRLGVTTAVIAVTVSVGMRFLYGNLLAGFLCGILVIAEALLGFFLCMRSFPFAAAVMRDGVPISQARQKTRSTVECFRSCGARFFFAFLPRILLGLLTLCVYLVWDVLPRMCVAYFIYCEQMDEMMIQSEEHKDHE